MPDCSPTCPTFHKNKPSKSSVLSKPVVTNANLQVSRLKAGAGCAVVYKKTVAKRGAFMILQQEQAFQVNGDKSPGQQMQTAGDMLHGRPFQHVHNNKPSKHSVLFVGDGYEAFSDRCTTAGIVPDS